MNIDAIIKAFNGQAAELAVIRLPINAALHQTPDSRLVLANFSAMAEDNEVRTMSPAGPSHSFKHSSNTGPPGMHYLMTSDKSPTEPVIFHAAPFNRMVAIAAAMDSHAYRVSDGAGVVAVSITYSKQSSRSGVTMPRSA